jgi:hypothetical protein
VRTDTSAVPGVVSKPAATVAARVVALTYVVGCTLSFQRTLEFSWNALPVAVSTNSAPPTTPDVGAIA